MNGLNFCKVHPPKSKEHLDDLVSFFKAKAVLKNSIHKVSCKFNFNGDKVFGYSIITLSMLLIVAFALMVAYNVSY